MVKSTKTAVIKRHTRRIEPYYEHKLFASVYASCLSVRTLSGEAELTADRVCKDMIPWLQKKLEITSADIRFRASEHLRVYNPQAAYIYKYHGAVR